MALSPGGAGIRDGRQRLQTSGFNFVCWVSILPFCLNFERFSVWEVELDSFALALLASVG